MLDQAAHPTDRGVVLSVQDLSVDIDSKHGLLHAVNGVSFQVRERDRVGIVGESGCGKSTLALSIMRLLSPGAKPVSGSIQFLGEDLLTLSETQMRELRGNEIGMVFQDPAASLNPMMAAGRQVAETIEAHKIVPRGTATRAAVDMMRSVRIPEPTIRAEQYPHQFSGGMRQRIVIAMGTVNRPKLIIADEPTTALDVTVQAQIIELLEEMNQETGSSIVFISHNIALVSEFCSRVIVMYAGSIVEEGPVSEVFSAPSHPYTSALIKSVPPLDVRLESGLVSIEGRPPDLADKQIGCPFCPRCSSKIEKCIDQRPPLTATGLRKVACWVADKEEVLLEA
ncbi:peptide ABC transporter ATP-binding protein [Ensifer sp. Root31]|uniref:ABC transporter ATP-binding protein n=1 Tax=Ensifer sp. Root31 TaxID=1736512 RepID=UPI000710D49B|nr:ABC transporter ATP-binding protein [Ensifer sp. Root31]KQU83903.1 peptide ABC transporter ATP-binding protein [Ensifer sp. Root31]